MQINIDAIHTDTHAHTDMICRAMSRFVVCMHMHIHKTIVICLHVYMCVYKMSIKLYDYRYIHIRLDMICCDFFLCIYIYINK